MDIAIRRIQDALAGASKGLMEFRFEEIVPAGLVDFSWVHDRLSPLQGSLWGSTAAAMSKNVQDAAGQIDFVGRSVADLVVLIFKSRATRHMSYFLLFNVVVMFLEYHIGQTRNSIGLLSDATHMLNDNMALMIGIVASAASSWTENENYTYGFERVRTLSGFVQSVLLVSFASRGFFTSLRRVFFPTVIEMDGLMVTSLIGLAVNVLGIVLLQTEDFEGHGHQHGHGGGQAQEQHEQEEEHDEHEGGEGVHGHAHSHMNENTQGMLLHVISDLLGSVAVVFASFFTAKGWYRVDPACSVVINLIILAEAFSLMKRTGEILLLRSPNEYVQSLKPQMEKLLELDGVVEVSNQHVWQCSSGKIVGSVHFVIEHDKFNHAYVEKLLYTAQRTFKQNGIDDTTVQVCPNSWCNAAKAETMN